MEWVKTGKRGPVGVVTLDREGGMNVLNMDSARELLEALYDFSGDPEVRCVVLTGRGKAFCAGGDIGAMKRSLEGEHKVLRYLPAWLHMIVAEMGRMDKPVITAVNGVAAGGGIGLALGGDLAYAVPEASFVFAYPAIGLSPDGGASLLAREIGYRRAMELMLTGKRLSASEALGLGLINGLFEADRLHDEVLGIAEAVASGPAMAFAAGKALFRRACSGDLEAQLEAERQALVRQSRTGEFREGVTSFLARKPPRFHE